MSAIRCAVAACCLSWLATRTAGLHLGHAGVRAHIASRRPRHRLLARTRASRLNAHSTRTEAKVDIRSAGEKGMGAFAAESISAGSWVGPYIGEILSKQQVNERYGSGLNADYLFKLDDELCIDAQNSTHFSRFFNHAQYGNLDVVVDDEEQTIVFFAERDIEAGEELTFDYGPDYWRFRGQPRSDTRNFSDPIYRERPPELALRYPPAVGTVLPLVPMNVTELQAALVLPEPECVAALQRCLNFFGAERTQSGGLSLPAGVGGQATLSPEDVTVETLQKAVVSCLMDAAVDPSVSKRTELRGADSPGADSPNADSPGADSLGTDPLSTGPSSRGTPLRDLAAWSEQMSPELRVIRQWRERMPRLASVRHDAVALAAYLVWKCPESHSVSKPLEREQCNELIAMVDREDSPDGALERLGIHSEPEHVRELVETLMRWYTIGEGCTMASDGGLPKLVGSVPFHLRVVWDRVPKLVQCGLLTY